MVTHILLVKLHTGLDKEHICNLIALNAAITLQHGAVKTRRYWNSFPSFSIVFVFIREPHHTELFRTEVGEEKNNIYIAIILVLASVLCLIQLERERNEYYYHPRLCNNNNI